MSEVPLYSAFYLNLNPQSKKHGRPARNPTPSAQAQLWQEVEKDPGARLPERLNWNQVRPKQLLEYLKRWRDPSLAIF